MHSLKLKLEIFQLLRKSLATCSEFERFSVNSSDPGLSNTAGSGSGFPVKTTCLQLLQFISKAAQENDETLRRTFFYAAEGKIKPFSHRLQAAFSEAKNSDQKIVLWLVHVDKITPKHKQPFEKIRDKVVAEWKSIKLKEQAIKHATEMISKASANTTLRQVLTTEGYPPKESQPFNRLGEIKRADTKNDMIQAICDDVFAMNLGETRYKEHNGKIIVFQSVKIERSKTKDEKKINAWKRELHSAITNDLFQQLMGYMSSQYKISINYDVLKEIDEPVDTNLDLF